MTRQALKHPGITLRSLAVSCFSILLLAILIQFFEVIEGSFVYDGESFAQTPLAVPAILIFLILVVIGSIFRLAARGQFLSRQEACRSK